LKFIRKSYEELCIGDETLEEMKKIGMKLKLTESLLKGEEKNIDTLQCFHLKTLQKSKDTSDLLFLAASFSGRFSIVTFIALRCI
jgi:hypothetical protein